MDELKVKVQLPAGEFISKVYAIDTKRHEFLVWNTLANCFTWVETCDLIEWVDDDTYILKRHVGLI